VVNVIRIGVVGCGGRGSGAIANVLAQNDNVEVAVLGDIRQASIDRCVNSLRTHTIRGEPLQGFNVPREQRFVGLDAYRSVIDSDVDIVFLATPPGFRPEHFAYAVERGKHVFCEKPIAVDPVGVRRFLETAQQAERQGTGVLAGTQRRHDRDHRETIRRIRAGHIGEIVSLRIYRTGNSIWYREREPGMSNRDYWLYNWYHIDFLSGDHIVEQHIHQYDAAHWVMEGPPAQAYGMGGRQYHTDRGGNIYDHFGVELEYANGVRGTSMCRQIQGTDGLMATDVIGTDGEARLSKMFCTIAGSHPWKSTGTDGGRLAYELEHRDFLESLRAGKPLNEGRQVAEATLSAIMAREAAYTGKVVTWEEMAHSDLKLGPENIKMWDGSYRPVPKPGMARG